MSRRKLSTVGLGVVASVLAACGSSASHVSSSAHASSGGGTGGTTPAAAVPFNSPEAKVPAAFPTPRAKPGVTFTLGYLNPNGGIPALDAEQHAAGAEAKALGGKMIAYSINANPTTQAVDFKLLLSQHVTAIAVQPVNPPALSPLLKQAAAAGIPVIATATPAVPGPPFPGYAADVMEGVDRCAYLSAKTVAQAKPKATYVLLSATVPVPAIQIFQARAVYWARRFGLKYLGSVSTGELATPASGSTAMSAIIAQHPSVDAVITFTDTVAEGAATTQKTRAGGHIMVTGLSGDPAAVQQVRGGSMFATCGETYKETGKQVAIAAYDAQTHQHVPLPREIAVPSYEITKSNGLGSGEG